jgi:hypothetical protein
MFVAHTAPTNHGVLDLAGYLTYPLFSALVGMGAVLAAERSTSTALWLRSFMVRGAVLVVLGLLLDRAGAQIVIVLVYLGLLTWVVSPLARLGTKTLACVGLGALVAAPPLRHSLLDERVHLYLTGHLHLVTWLDYFVTGDNYRLVSMIGFAGIGMVLARIARPGHPPLDTVARQLLAGGALLVVAAVDMGANQAGIFTFRAYEASWREHAFCALLVAMTILLGLALARLASSYVRPLVAMGRMSLTLYTVQVLYLAVYVHVIRPGQSDNSWFNLGLLIVGSAGLALAWQWAVRQSPFQRGPLEGITALAAGPQRPVNATS